jgi:membrane-associated phospholipid phosphatase
MFVVFIFAQALCPLEQNIYTTLSKDWQVKPINYTMKGISYVGHPVVGISTPFLYMLFDNEKAGQHDMLGLVGCLITVFPLKYSINRQRPDGEHSRWEGSFPSGHTAFAFSHAYVLGHHYPKMRIPSYAFAATVGFSRLYLGKHYITDVLTGMVLGVLVGYASVKILD